MCWLYAVHYRIELIKINSTGFLSLLVDCLHCFYCSPLSIVSLMTVLMIDWCDVKWRIVVLFCLCLLRCNAFSLFTSSAFFLASLALRLLHRFTMQVLYKKALISFILRLAFLPCLKKALTRFALCFHCLLWFVVAFCLVHNLTISNSLSLPSRHTTSFRGSNDVILTSERSIDIGTRF